MFLNSSIARQIAESSWGRGGTASYKTNRKGSYYFSCSSHGGFVISAAALSSDEYNKISEFSEPMTIDVYVSNDDDSVLLVMHPFRTRSGRIRGIGKSGYRVVKEEFFMLEEDCAWCLAVVFADIMVKDMTKEEAQKTFYYQYDESNPVVSERIRVASLRKNGYPDLIISASSIGEGQVKVWTADEKQYVVSGYENSRDEFGNPYLSRCKVLEEIV